MAVRDFFSKRAERAARAGTPDVFQYQKLPQPFRVQVIHIWQRAVGALVLPNMASYTQPAPTFWAELERQIAEEHGRFTLDDNFGDPLRLDACANYFLKLESTPRALDVIEASFNAIDEHVRPNLQFAQNYITQHPDNAIDDLNRRFREHSIGYQYASGQLVRVDSQYVHAEAVKPALSLLQTDGFSGAQDEFMRAHGHYRSANYKEAINDALKAFESTMKSICDQRKWPYDKNKSTAKALLDVLLDRELIPKFLDGGIGGLRSTLEGLVPTSRNRTSGHGQGSTPLEVPDYLAAYVLHVTASNIVLFVEAHKAKR